MIGRKFGRLLVKNECDGSNGHKKYLCLCDCGNTLSVFYTNLHSGCTSSCGCYAKEVSSAVGKLGRHNSEKFINDSISIFGADSFDYSKVEYINGETKVTLGCNNCKQTFMTRPRVHKMGKGCPHCASSGYKIAKPGVFYILESSECLKVGITNRTSEARKNQLNKNRIDKFHVVTEFSFKFGQTALDLETNILRYLKQNYTHPTNRLAGWRESFVGVDIQRLVTNIHEFLKYKSIT